MKNMIGVIIVLTIGVILYAIDIYPRFEKKFYVPYYGSPCLIHKQDSGYLCSKGRKKCIVSYKNNNGAWITKEFYNFEISIMDSSDYFKVKEIQRKQSQESIKKSFNGE